MRLAPLQALPSPPLAGSQRASTSLGLWGCGLSRLGEKAGVPHVVAFLFHCLRAVTGGGGTPCFCISDSSPARAGSRVVTPRPSWAPGVLGKSKRCDDPSPPGGGAISQTGVQAGA